MQLRSTCGSKNPDSVASMALDTCGLRSLGHRGSWTLWALRSIGQGPDSLAGLSGPMSQGSPRVRPPGQTAQQGWKSRAEKSKSRAEKPKNSFMCLVWVYRFTKQNDHIKEFFRAGFWVFPRGILWLRRRMTRLPGWPGGRAGGDMTQRIAQAH